MEKSYLLLVLVVCYVNKFVISFFISLEYFVLSSALFYVKTEMVLDTWFWITTYTTVVNYFNTGPEKGSDYTRITGFNERPIISGEYSI